MTETVKPLRGKYFNLFVNLLEADRITDSLEETEDGGTCNFDALMLDLPRWKADNVREAAKKANWNAWKYYGSTWIFSFPTTGQGNRRTRRAEALAKELGDRGYKTGVYYQMD